MSRTDNLGPDNWEVGDENKIVGDPAAAMTLQLLSLQKPINYTQDLATMSSQPEYASSLHFTSTMLPSDFRSDRTSVHDSAGNFCGPQDVTQ